MQGLRVKCTNCGEIRHETTEHYDPDVTPKGNFVRLIDPWKTWRWNCFDDQGENTSTTSCSMMTCPGCAAALAPSGRLTVLEKVKTLAEINQDKMDAEFSTKEMDELTNEAFKKPLITHKVVGDSISIPLQDAEKLTGGECTCKICGKVCKSPFGLQAHMRSHSKK